jgi:hypothetical protein
VQNHVIQIPVPRIHAIRILDARIAALACLLVCASITAAAQKQTEPPSSPVIPGISSNTTPAPDPSMRRMSAQMALRRNAQRQQQIVADTTRLLQLAQKLNDEVSKSSKDELSVSVVKEAEEIEKLAKSIKGKMRDGT